jgi:hypothetical protein
MLSRATLHGRPEPEYLDGKVHFAKNRTKLAISEVPNFGAPIEQWVRAEPTRPWTSEVMVLIHRGLS